ncbi:MAG: hypothetical protein AB2L14_01245 [Candidatus Xenobiia bacterium LiM19]
MASDRQSPIKDLLTIDMIGRRKDGGVDLGIIVSGRLTGSREDQQPPDGQGGSLSEGDKE